MLESVLEQHPTASAVLFHFPPPPSLPSHTAPAEAASKDGLGLESLWDSRCSAAPQNLGTECSCHQHWAHPGCPLRVTRRALPEQGQRGSESTAAQSALTWVNRETTADGMALTQRFKMCTEVHTENTGITPQIICCNNLNRFF